MLTAQELSIMLYLLQVCRTVVICLWLTTGVKYQIVVHNTKEIHKYALFLQTVIQK